MWAFAIYDHESKKIFCSRDRFGIKPFNYFFNESQFIFSSEIKSILNYNKNLKKPIVNLHGKAKKRLENVESSSISISNDGGFVVSIATFLIKK